MLISRAHELTFWSRTNRLSFLAIHLVHCRYDPPSSDYLLFNRFFLHFLSTSTIQNSSKCQRRYDDLANCSHEQPPEEGGKERKDASIGTSTCQQGRIGAIDSSRCPISVASQHACIVGQHHRPGFC